MSKKLYVGNLSYALKSSELLEVFKKVGEVVSANVITDLETGQSKGFAFVEMATDELGKRAILELNELSLGGRNMLVSEAKPRPERPSGGNRFGGERKGGFRNKK